MDASSRAAITVPVRLMAVGVLLCTACTPMGIRGSETTTLELRIDADQTKTVTVALGQSASKVFRLCRPAKVYADDDPVLSCPAAGGGAYALFFSPKSTKGPYDARNDSLYAAVHYPKSPRDGGVFVLPKTMQGRTCGEFVTLSVTLGTDGKKIASVLLGMSPSDVTRLFKPARDHADDDGTILYNSSHGGRYLLVFSPPSDNEPNGKHHGRLSEVAFHPGGEDNALFLTPRKKRGTPLPPGHIALLGAGAGSTSHVTKPRQDAVRTRPKPAKQHPSAKRQEYDKEAAGQYEWYFNPVTKHYYAITKPARWGHAQAQAERAGGDLVTINDAAEGQWLGQVLKEMGVRGTVYIGLTDRDEEGVWKWVSGEDAEFRDWARGEPNNLGDEDVVEFGVEEGHKNWNDSTDANIRPGVIERPTNPQGNESQTSGEPSD